MDQLHRREPYGYRKSRNTLTRMTAIRLGPERIEVAVQMWDLCRGNGQVFLRKFHEALKDTPKLLVIYLSHGPELSETGVALLTWARAQAEASGIRFLLRPASERLAAPLRAGGLGEALAA